MNAVARDHVHLNRLPVGQVAQEFSGGKFPNCSNGDQGQAQTSAPKICPELVSVRRDASIPESAPLTL